MCNVLHHTSFLCTNVKIYTIILQYSICKNYIYAHFCIRIYDNTRHFIVKLDIKFVIFLIYLNFKYTLILHIKI